MSDDVAKKLRATDLNETSEYVLLYGKFESILDGLGPNVEELLKSRKFAFGEAGDDTDRSWYANEYHSLYHHIVLAFLKSREPVSPLIQKNLKRFSTSEPYPSVDFESFARRSVLYVLDICHNEQQLQTKFFYDGPLMADYKGMGSWDSSYDYADRLEGATLAHLGALQNFLTPHLSNGDLQRICKLVNWLETIYITSTDGEDDRDSPRDDRRFIAQTLLIKHLWPLLDTLFIKAAAEIEHFKPTPEDLKFTTKHIPLAGARKQPSTGQHTTEDSDDRDLETTTVLNAYPTVRTAVRLLVMYNEGSYDRPVRPRSFY